MFNQFTLDEAVNDIPASLLMTPLFRSSINTPGFTFRFLHLADVLI